MKSIFVVAELMGFQFNHIPVFGYLGSTFSYASSSAKWSKIKEVKLYFKLHSVDLESIWKVLS